MKYLLLLLILLPSLCSGQKYYAKKIKKTTDVMGVIYKCPDQKHMSLVKQCKADSFFCLHIYIKDGHEHFEATGIEIHFQDGAVLRDANAKINCQQVQAELGSGYAGSANPDDFGAYLLQGFFPISEPNIEKLVSKRITMVVLHNVPQKISEKEATNIRAYIRSMRDLR